ncbi:MAG: DUF11 domain-containing protein [Bacilli bacterium]|nr:DUF11 domain-containing protein [Bacilli bacterium]
MFKKIFIICFSILLMFPLVVKADDAEIEKQRNAVIKSAEAYLNQGMQVHYDSYRKQLYATPEDATSQHIVYTVCSGITFQAYYQALGIELPSTTETLLAYAKANDGSAYVLDYYDKAELSSLGANTTEIGAAILAKWLPIIKPGDIIVHTGHAMLVHSVDVANDKIQLLEAAIGARYDASTHTDAVDTTNTLVYRQLKNKIGAVVDNDELALIRPTKDGNKYLYQGGNSDGYTYTEKTYSGITASATSRMNFPEIDIEKTINIKDGTSQNLLAGLNEEIEYTIVITNKSSSNYGALTLTENIPDFLEIKDNGSGALNGRKLSWNISSINAGEAVTFKYTVKVPNDKKYLGKTFVSTGDVSNIKTAKIETIIGTKYSSEEKSKLKLAYEEIKNNDSIERKFINDIYKKAFNLDLGISELSNLDIMGYDATVTSTGKDTLAVKRTKLKDSSAAKYIYHNFYGPRLFEGVNKSVNSNRDCPDNSLVRIMLHWNIFVTNELNDRARNIFPSMLLDGDIILLYTNDTTLPDDKTKCPTETLENRSYIYLDNKLIRKKTKTDFEEISGTELETFLNDMVGENYVILRPSNEKKKVEDVAVEDTAKGYGLPIGGIVFICVGLGMWFLVIQNNKMDEVEEI